MKLDDIQLSNFNPRYSDIELGDGIEKLQQENNDYNEVDIAKNLFSYESHDPDKFIDLLESLSSGFKKGIDKPIFIKSNIKGKMIVIEGNRRLLALKLLNSKISIEEITDDYQEKLEKIKIIIDSHQTSNFEFKDDMFDILTDPEQLWPALYTRHNGESKGKRNWPRAKYLFDLRSYVISATENPDKIDNIDVKEAASKRFHRTGANIDADLRSAIWYYELITSYNSDKTSEEKISPYKEVNKSKSALKPSALEPTNLSNVRVNDENLFTLLGIKINTKSFKVEITEETATAKSKKNFKQISDFIINSYLNKYFTTRGWKETNTSKLIDFLNNDTKEISLENRSIGTLVDEFEKENGSPTKNDEKIKNKNNSPDYEVKNSAASVLDNIKKIKKIFLPINIQNNNPHLEVVRITILALDKLKLKDYPLEQAPFNFVGFALRNIWEHVIYYLIENSNQAQKHFRNNIKKPKQIQEGSEVTVKHKDILFTDQMWQIFKYFYKWSQTTKDDPNKHVNDWILESKNGNRNSSEFKEILDQDSNIFKQTWVDKLNELVHVYSICLKEGKVKNIFPWFEIQLEILGDIINYLLK